MSLPVLILAAGRGERMRPLTDTMPKPLLPAGGKPLICHHVERLAAAGFADLVINHARFGEQIESELGDGSRFGVRIRYSAEGNRPLETGGGIKRALPLLAGEVFLVVNADIYTEFPFADLTLAGPDLAHLVLVNNPPHHPAGDFSLNTAGRIGQGEPRLTFSGIGVYHRALFADTPGGAFPLAPLLRAAAARNLVGGRHYTGHWRDIGTPARLRSLDLDLRAPQP